MDSKRQRLLKRHQEKKVRLRAAFDRFLARVAGIEERRNKFAKEITEQLEREQLEQARQELDKQ